MKDAFGIVLFAVVALAAVAAVWAAWGSGDAYRQIGRGGLSIGDDEDRPARAPSGAVAASERDAEIRQMLEARNARRVARGQEPVDVEAELAALTRPVADPGLETEVRQLVEARNARRIRAGKEPLDVDREVARQLRDLF
jgi:hypothetical protein